jgi:hypothetical protein
MIKSNFNDLGVVGKLETQAITFILVIRVLVVEKVVENLGFTMEYTKIRFPSSKILRGQKCKDVALEQNFVPTVVSGWP